MTNPVDPSQIEQIVGAERHATRHYGRAVSAEQTVYVLHSQQCTDATPDLRDCPYSLALDRGIDLAVWGDLQDRPVILAIKRGHLIPDVAPKVVLRDG